MKAAILGYGTVGSGTYECLLRRPEQGVAVAKILERRDIGGIARLHAASFEEILGDASIEAVAETLGGDEPAYTYVKQALTHGKSVVTANKQMLARHYAELIALARAEGVTLAYSAAAGGGIPWLHNLLRIRRADDVLALGGVMNGTSNFILERMQSLDGDEFEKALRQARELGYAEADPSADIDGSDIKAKLALSCDTAWSVMLAPDDIPALGIRHISKTDIAHFRTLGLKCRLTGWGESTKDGVAAFVEPTLYAPEAAEYSLAGAGNIIACRCERAGTLTFSGLGAGGEPTGAAVAGDLFDIAAGVSLFDTASCVSQAVNRTDETEHEYYLRTDAEIDGSLIARRLGANACITKKVSVQFMHGEVGRIAASGREVFAAGVKQC